MSRTMPMSFALLGLCFILSACSVPPEGLSKGRVSPTTTTEGEMDSHQIFPAAILEASDQFAQQLALDLANIPIIRDLPGQATVLMGDINNKTDIVSSNEFELLRSRLRNSLLQSSMVSRKLAFVENRGRMRSIAAREEVGANPVDAGPQPYDPQSTFALNMDVYRIIRGSDKGDSNLYYIETQLVNFATNQIVAAPKRYELKQWKP